MYYYRFFKGERKRTTSGQVNKDVTRGSFNSVVKIPKW